MNKLKITVIGATGFIGRHVINELLRHDVIVTATYYSNNNNLSNLSKIRWVYFDINTLSDGLFYELGEPDVLINLSWSGLSNYDSPHHYETELYNQYIFLKKMVISGLKSVVVTGTCFEYGMQSGPISKNTETNPNNSYGLAKDFLRKKLQLLQKRHDFYLTWARLFYMYGDGQSESSLFSQLKKSVLDNKKVFKMSGGEQIRDYLPVSEVAKQLVLLSKQTKNIGIINVCSGKPKSVRGIVEQWIYENRWDIELKLGHYPYTDYEPMAYWGIKDEV